MSAPDGAILRAVGARIAELRRERGLTQEELSQRLAVTAKYVQRVEQGVENLALETLERIAAALDVTPLQLLLPPLEARTARAGASSCGSLVTRWRRPSRMDRSCSFVRP